MTLLITIIAAVISTVIWYKSAFKDSMKISMLCFMYWGAALMWLVDAVFEYAELREEYFTPPVQDMTNDAFLGFCVVALGMVVWLVRLLVSDPKKHIEKSLQKKIKE